MRIACLTATLVFLTACQAGGGGRRDGAAGDTGTAPEAGTDATGLPDAATEMCETDPDCADAYECTIDVCGIGNVCNHRPIDEMCPMGQRCSPTMGCTSGCTTDEDCNDGQFCNGQERCIAGDCFMGTAQDCDDGNDCTMDICDTDLNGCRYATLCDSGIVPGDGGMAEPFDPDLHYMGTFLVAPAPSQDCLGASFRFSEVTFSAGADLQITAGALTLTQSPKPSGASFDTHTSRAGCADYELSGMFSDSDNFTGRFTSTATGGTCGICGTRTWDIIGFRR